MEVQWYHAWSDSSVPKETHELVHCHGVAPRFQIPKDEDIQGRELLINGE